MLERLMNPERPHGEPEYSNISKQISEIRKFLENQLNPDAHTLLEQLSNAYIRQGNIMLADAFTDGFCTAVELMLIPDNLFDKQRNQFKLLIIQTLQIFDNATNPCGIRYSKLEKLGRSDI